MLANEPERCRLAYTVCRLACRVPIGGIRIVHRSLTVLGRARNQSLCPRARPKAASDQASR